MFNENRIEKRIQKQKQKKEKVKPQYMCIYSEKCGNVEVPNQHACNECMYLIHDRDTKKEPDNNYDIEELQK